MSKSLCSADETRVLHFLKRAGAAIIASGWQEPTLGILDWHKADASNPDHRDRHPELGALADEFFGPFESEAVQPDTFASMAEAYSVMLGTDAEGNVPFHFRTFAHKETSYWELGDTPLARFMPFPIFGLYMIREGDPTRYGDFLENVFCYPDMPEGSPVNRYGQNEIEAYFDGAGAELVHNGEGWERIEFADPSEMDANPHYSPRYDFSGDPLDLVFNSEVMESLNATSHWDYERNAIDAIKEDLARQVTEGAREYFAGNSCQPQAILAA